ncbi:MAG: folylpolyglutamate synthase/dihydrofolate synthase family protein [Bacteroidota bacterium]
MDIVKPLLLLFTHTDTLQFLYSLQSFGIKLGLGNTEQLLSSLGNPHDKYCSIHVAGTNGKGSTAAMLASVLTAAGIKTGLYTSPHLVNFSERIRVDGQPISDDSIVNLTALLRPRVEALRATFFETTTAMAFQYFCEHDIDVAIVETGLGGRLDATNVLQPILAVITSIGLDHVEHLGRDLGSVAREKGGIIKRNLPCVIGATPKEALDVLSEMTVRNESTLVRTASVASHSIRENSPNRLVSDFVVFGNRYPRLRIGLPGRHQVRNAELALASLEILKRIPKFPFARRLTKSAIRKGFRDIGQFSGLRARLEILRRRPMILVDVAHNPEAVRTLKKALQDFGLTKLIVVFGVMKDKDWRSVLRELGPCAKPLIGVRAEVERALPSLELVRECRRLGIEAVDGGDVRSGIDRALHRARSSDTILIVGSHYVAGEALKVLEQG